MDQSKNEQERYGDLVNEIAPKNKMISNTVKAFIVGGLICDFGHGIKEFFIWKGFEDEKSAMITTVILILIGVTLTGLGLYEKLGKFAGGGSIVPITGFANSVASPSIEYKKEGLVYGVGARMFTVAGPVILYGTLTSFVVGLVYYIYKIFIEK